MIILSTAEKTGLNSAREKSSLENSALKPKKLTFAFSSPSKHFELLDPVDSLSGK